MRLALVLLAVAAASCGSVTVGADVDGGRQVLEAGNTDLQVHEVAQLLEAGNTSERPPATPSSCAAAVSAAGYSAGALSCKTCTEPQGLSLETLCEMVVDCVTGGDTLAHCENQNIGPGAAGNPKIACIPALFEAACPGVNPS